MRGAIGGALGQAFVPKRDKRPFDPQKFGGFKEYKKYLQWYITNYSREKNKIK